MNNITNFTCKESQYNKVPSNNNNQIFIRDVVFDNGCTICYWSDNTKTEYIDNSTDAQVKNGLCVCIVKKMLGIEQYEKIISKWSKLTHSMSEQDCLGFQLSNEDIDKMLSFLRQKDKGSISNNDSYSSKK